MIRIVRALIEGRTWREFAYTLVSFLLGLPAFVLALLGVVSSILSLFTIGLPLLVGVLFLARGTVGYFQIPARRLLGWDWPSPPRRGIRHPIRWGASVLKDGDAWRALAYCFLQLPLLGAAAYGGMVLLAVGSAAVTYPLWWRAAPDGFSPSGWGGALLLGAEGLAALLVFPWFVRLLVAIDHWLVRALLEPSPDRARIAALEASRAELRADAAAVLRRVERNLHDGTQARLVGLGVTIARIEHRIEDPQTRQLAEEARGAVAEALTELRDIVRGMHPPALDDGLATALGTLTARSAVPVATTIDLAERPTDATASALYFVVAELLTNVARHASASRVQVDLRDDGQWLRLEVADDGQGGAQAGTGTGLAGLTRRVRALDGTLTITSPPGGPTAVVVALPKKG